VASGHPNRKAFPVSTLAGEKRYTPQPHWPQESDLAGNITKARASGDRYD